MKTIRRLVGDALVQRLRVMPAVVVTGARQTGKSTLAEELVPGTRRFASLDDLDVRNVVLGDLMAGEEVDFVIETGGKLLPIEIKARARPRLADTAHLCSFRAEYGKKARAGLLLHTGSSLDWLAPDVLAAPWWRLL